MNVETYRLLKTLITAAGFGDDITWAENIEPCESADLFQREHSFVVCNSGMRAKTACQIFRKVQQALEAGRPLGEVFKHESKCRSIQHVYDRREELFARFKEVEGEGDDAILAYLVTLPHIGDTVKYHLAKNLGIPVSKPDRHLVKISAHFGTDTKGLCSALAEESGDKVTTVDTVIWRAASFDVAIIGYEGDVPLIPMWPSDRDEMNVSCPQCGRRERVNVGFVRREALAEWTFLCEDCNCGYMVEPRAGGLWMAGIEGQSSFEPFILEEQKPAPVVRHGGARAGMVAAPQGQGREVAAA